MKHIKNYFKKKSNRPGPGRRLGSGQPDDQKPAHDKIRADNAAGNAALDRFQQNTKSQAPINVSAQNIKKRALEELAKESQTPMNDDVKQEDKMDNLFYECPDLLPHLSLPKSMLMKQIEEYLINDISENSLVASALLFRTFNQKVNLTKPMNIILTYLRNVKAHPDELSKYGRIRLENKIFQENLKPMKYINELMNAIGFKLEDENQDPVFLFDSELMDQVDIFIDVLTNIEPINIQLSRDTKIFKYSKTNTNDEVDSFYELSANDVRKRHELIRQNNEQSEMLMTRQMRENMMSKKSFSHCVVRIRFSDGLMLQGIFRPNENLSDVVEFVRSHLEDPEFVFELNYYFDESKLTKTIHSKDSENKLNLLNDLCPAVVFNFKSNPEMKGIELLNAQSKLLIGEL